MSNDTGNGVNFCYLIRCHRLIILCPHVCLVSLLVFASRWLRKSKVSSVEPSGSVRANCCNKSMGKHAAHNAGS